MTEDGIDRRYVERYVNQAKATDNPDLKNNCLYRAGTQMEIIECNANDNLTPEQQQIVLDAAEKMLGS